MSDPQQPYPAPQPQTQTPPYAGAAPGYAAPQAAAHGTAAYGAPQVHTGTPSATNTPGRVGLICGLVGLAVGVVFTIIVRALILSASPSAIGVINLLQMLVVGVAGVLALVFGLIGIRREGAPKVIAGVAIGLGIAGTANLVIALAMNLLDVVMYGL